ncbi:2624_t:CDS:2, partial [Cetraspora pellucida]
TEESITTTSATSTASTANENNPDFAYYKIYELNLVRSQQKLYPYTHKGSNISNMIAHLHDKHNIIKDNYTDYLDEHNEYPTLNLVYPCIEVLKKGFVSETDETVDIYLNFIYKEAENDDNKSDETSDNDISAADTFARSCGCEQNRRMPRQSNNEDLKDIDKVKDLLPVSIASLLNRVQTTIYLSMDELWSVLSDNALVVILLDPSFKHFKWATNNIEKGLVNRSYSNNDDFFQDLEADSAQTNMEKDNKITSCKYLSILATSVSSKRLFSDASNYISAKQACLSFDLVNKYENQKIIIEFINDHKEDSLFSNLIL